MSINKDKAKNTHWGKSILFAETARDKVDTAIALAIARNGVNTTAALLARAAVHEVGHQFGLAVPSPPGPNPPVDGNGHRRVPPNTIMGLDPGFVLDASFHFDPNEIVELRNRRETP